ncbi:hypothetical protein JCM10449v2_000457 [Rhodotorula kratochvilovae]
MSSRPGSYHDPYDAVDDLPEYPHDADGNPSHGFSSRWSGKETDAAPLIKGGRREDEPIPLDVDGFAYELGRVHHDIDTLCASLGRVAALKAQVLALASEDNTLVAQSLLADLGVQTSGAARLFADLPAQLRAFAGKIAHLKPGAGRFLVTSGESAPLKNELAECADGLRASVREILQKADEEEKDKPQARVRLLKVIKAQFGGGADDAQMMAALLTAEREGSAALAEQLKAGTPSWRWAVERPFSRLQQEVAKAGDLSFLDGFKAAPTPAPSSWLNPVAYVPTLPLKTPKSAAASRPPSYLSRASSVTSAAASTQYAPLEEDRVSSYGEPLEPPEAKAPSRWTRVALGAVVLLVVAGSGVAVVLWSKKVEQAAGGAAELPVGAGLPV